jgi:hypothetical protein
MLTYVMFIVDNTMKYIKLAVPGNALLWLSPIPSRRAPSRPVPPHPFPSRSISSLPVPSRPAPSRPVGSLPAPSYTIPSHPVLSRRVPSHPVPYIKKRAYWNARLRQKFEAIGEELSDIKDFEQTNTYMCMYEVCRCTNTRVLERNVVSNCRSDRRRSFEDYSRIHRFPARHRFHTCM